MKSIDLNCDMGESFGSYRIGADEAVMPHITSANIACGWHAGDPSVMERTVRMAVEQGVKTGAHPGYPDPMGFGRRFMELSFEELRNAIVYQVGALRGFCSTHGIDISHVKPHGALYNNAMVDETVARGIAEGVASIDTAIPVFVLAGKKGQNMARICRENGLRVVFEAFPDRAYTPEGNLAPRSMEGAVKTDPSEIAERALMMAEEQRVVDTDGNTIEIEAETLCLHGDTPEAATLVRSIRSTLETSGVIVKAV
ncbi:LamB/YcsF family protein [Desulfoluna butyratoxydans]|uniref:5-oxoprolinase subunit A n=1 Tax=Desulfoluna butyratoxydans TaxID=231438 RepID=A0A4U8YRI1_9BACT|nr:5-oxoprolinase subunit PxpA [Desulfoluna butyratoxydans]VFQ46087.1 glycoside hydrolase/deacetylase beta/alpha-barrel [Desulfoluna butyratoxydans]